MKTAFIFFTTFLLGSLLMGSCTKDDNATIKDQIETNMTKGTWRITKFIDSGQDELAHFTGYNFTFQRNGVLKASNNTSNYDGTWNISAEKIDDDSLNDLHFNIFFNLTNSFEDLNDDWHIISRSATKIELVDVSGGNGDTDYLTFEKN